LEKKMTLKTVMGASLAALALTLAACDNAGDSKSGEIVKAETAKTAKLGTFGIALDAIDESVQPGENFYEYVNGNWLKATEIPSDRSRYGSFSVLADQAEKRVRDIIESAANSDNPSADEKRIGDFYKRNPDFLCQIVTIILMSQKKDKIFSLLIKILRQKCWRKRVLRVPNPALK